MATLDVAMPLALLAVSAAALFFNERTEGKLKTTFEERELRTRDVVLLVVMIVVAVSIIGYVSILNPGQIFQNIIMLVFLFSYSMLLFVFSYLFSDMKQRRAQLFSLGFAVAGLFAGTISLLAPFADDLTLFRALAFYGLAVFAFASIILDMKRVEVKERWYVAVQPPALFILLFAFFSVAYNGNAIIWYPVLMDIFGLTFAILIILYLGSMFTWKTVGVFAVLLTIMDIILVIGTGTMVNAADTFRGLGLPVLVYLPNVPFILVPSGYTGLTFFGYAPRGLGLGDFFFAGILALQTYKKFGKKTAYISIIAMTVAFAVWEAFLPEILTILNPIVGRDIGGFPGTLMIICGWAPVIAWQLIATRNKPKEPEVPQTDA
jgi:hypothetical protein